MTKKDLYRIIRPDGGITVSPQMPTGMDYTIMYRIIADEGKILTDGETTTCCVDIEVEDLDKWQEIEEE